MSYSQEKCESCMQPCPVAVWHHGLPNLLFEKLVSKIDFSLYDASDAGKCCLSISHRCSWNIFTT